MRLVHLLHEVAGIIKASVEYKQGNNKGIAWGQNRMNIGQIQSSVVIVCGVAAMLATFLSIFILMRIFFMSKKTRNT